MKYLKRKLLLTFLFLIYLLGSMAVFSSFILEFHRLSFQSSLSSVSVEKKEILFFSNLEFKKIKWEETNEEFELDNKMYDVSKIIKCPGGFKIYCVNDSEEESLIAMINQWKQSTSQSKIKLFQPQFFSKILCTQTKLFSYLQLFSTEYFFKFESLTIQIASPPPELV